jgi:hypothetical protein
MTQPPEGETVYFADKEGKPTTREKAVSAEVIDGDKGMHKLMVRDNGEGPAPKDPFS